MTHVTSRDGTRIGFERIGSGPALILVGGAFCDRTARAAGRPLAALLAAQHTVYSFDRRGRGDSTNTAPYAVAREIEDLAALVAEAGGNAALYGHSSGAVLALAAAERGVPVSKLALYEPPLLVGASRPLPPVDFAAQLAGLCALGRPGDAAELFLTVGVGVPAPVVAAMREAPHWPAMERMAPTLAHDATITSQPEAAAILAATGEVRVPALVIDGGASPAWAREVVASLAAALPHGIRQTLDKQTHDADPTLVAAALAKFLA